MSNFWGRATRLCARSLPPSAALGAASPAYRVIRTGSEGQIAKAADVLATTRRDLYRILADGDVGAQAGGKPDGGDESDPGAGAGTVDGDS